MIHFQGSRLHSAPWNSPPSFEPPHRAMVGCGCHRKIYLRANDKPLPSEAPASLPSVSITPITPARRSPRFSPPPSLDSRSSSADVCPGNFILVLGLQPPYNVRGCTSRCLFPVPLDRSANLSVPHRLHSSHPETMSGLGGDFGVRFARETWALYAVGLLGGLLRLYVFLALGAWASQN